MADKRYLVDARGQGAYDTSYDGPMNQGSTHGQGMQSIAIGVDSSVQGNIMNREAVMPSSYMLQNILVLIFCSCIIGIIGLSKGSQVSSLYRSGETFAAEVASKEARKWCRIGIVVGCFVKAFLIGFLIVYMIYE